MITFCSLCKDNIDTKEPCYHRESLLRKLRVYSNKVNEVTSKLEAGDIDEDAANEETEQLDNYYANLINGMFMESVSFNDDGTVS